MKFFIDTEFIEGFTKTFWRQRRHFIELISIGIVAEDGSRYYAISSEFNPSEADQWVKDNVIAKLEKNALLYRTKKQIAQDILEFVNSKQKSYESRFHDPAMKGLVELPMTPIQFYAYFADYDWVLFCSLFGRMIDLPLNFPMYCRDIKQMLDEKLESMDMGFTENIFSFPNHPTTLDEKLRCIKFHPMYPKQVNEHIADEDAMWTKNLYHFIKELK